MFIKEGNYFPGKQKFDSKTQNMFDNFQLKCFFKSFIQTQFPRRGLSKSSDGEVYLETFLKDSSEDVTKVNKMMSYTECRLSHCELTHEKKTLVWSRIFVVIKHTTPYMREGRGFSTPCWTLGLRTKMDPFPHYFFQITNSISMKLCM